MDTLFQNLRYALRQLRKSPGFALTVVLTLALGIGANAAVFTLFDQVLLRMLPVQQPKELVRFQWTGGFSGSASSFGGEISNYFSYPMYRDLRDKSSAFSGLIATAPANVGVSWKNQSEAVSAEMVSGNYFNVLGVRPALGRVFNGSDETARQTGSLGMGGLFGSEGGPDRVKQLMALYQDSLRTGPSANGAGTNRRAALMTAGFARR